MTMNKYFSTELLTANIGKDLFVSPPYLQNGDVVELCGEQGSGRSSLLQHLMIECILPKHHNGCNAGVIYFDLDCHFELLRVISIIERRTGASEEEVKKWLKNLHIVRCDSSEQLVITLHSMEPLIANSQVPVSLIILDSISSFYWIDSSAIVNTSVKDAFLQKVVQILQVFKDRYNVCVLASTQQLINPDQKLCCNIGGDMVMYKPFLCRQWQDFVKYKFIMTAATFSTDGTCAFNIYCVCPSRYKKQFVIEKQGVRFL